MGRLYIRMGKSVKMSVDGKNLLGIGQDIDYSEKKKASGLHLPLYWGYCL